jgi:hypothetical protein
MRIAVAGATGRLGWHVTDVLTERGHQVVAMSRATGVDIIIGAWLDAVLTGVDVIVDAATGPLPEQEPATEFFVTAAHNLQAAGVRAGVRRAVVVSIINIDKSAGGYALANPRRCGVCPGDADADRRGPDGGRGARRRRYRGGRPGRDRRDRRRRGIPVRVQAVRNPADPDAEMTATGGLLPGPGALLAGPTFGQWLSEQREQDS